MVKKLSALIIILTISVLTSIVASSAEIKDFYITDPETDLSYNIIYSNEELYVLLNGNTIGKTYVEDITSFSIYNNILYVFYSDNLNDTFCVYSFDFYNDSIDSSVVNAKAFYNEHCFSAESFGKFYFVSGNDTKKLCVFENNAITEVNMKAQIKQLLLVDDTLIVLTTEGTFLYSDTNGIQKSSCPLSVPAQYAGNNIITDSAGTELLFINGKISKAEAETTAKATAYESAINISSLLEHGFYEADEGTTVSKIKKAFSDLEVTKVRKADEKSIDNGKVGTGATISFGSGETITVIIYGELTGEGNINSRDAKTILNHLCEKEALNSPFLTAADVDKDGEVTTKDALMISKMY